MRVVVDTNILVSACWKPDGLEARTLNMILAGTITAVVSPAVRAEYWEVLQREKFRRVRDRTAALLSALDARVVRVEPAGTVCAAADEDDNRFLECAAEGRACYLITGNLKHYPPHWGGTKIVNARGFLAAEGGL